MIVILPHHFCKKKTYCALHTQPLSSNNDPLQTTHCFYFSDTNHARDRKPTCWYLHSYLISYFRKQAIERLGAMIPEVSTPIGAAPGVSRWRSMPYLYMYISRNTFTCITRRPKNNHLLFKSYPIQSNHARAETNLWNQSSITVVVIVIVIVISQSISCHRSRSEG